MRSQRSQALPPGPLPDLQCPRLMLEVLQQRSPSCESHSPPFCLTILSERFRFRFHLMKLGCQEVHDLKTRVKLVLGEERIAVSQGPPQVQATGASMQKDLAFVQFTDQRLHVRDTGTLDKRRQYSLKLLLGQRVKCDSEPALIHAAATWRQVTLCVLGVTTHLLPLVHLCEPQGPAKVSPGILR